MESVIKSIPSAMSLTVPLALLFVGIYLGSVVKFFHFRHPVKTLKRSFAGAGKNGQVKALIMSLGGTLGVGNIAGVSLALIYGGEGSVFWMWISACVVMAIKYSEVLLAQKYRKKCKGGYEGGAMYYIRDGAGYPTLAALFGLLSISASVFIGSLIQANAVSESLGITFGMNPFILGIVLSIIVFILSIGGIDRVSFIMSVIVPFMSVLYIIMSFSVIFGNIDVLPGVFARIIKGAFNVRAAASGGGYGMLMAIKNGIARGMFSNEAGVGTSPMAHATAKSDFPARQGVMGIIEVFCDTILLCTLTALSILCVFDKIPRGVLAMQLVICAYENIFGSCAGVLISISVFFFAFATILLWSYYGQVCIGYFSDSHTLRIWFLVVYAISVGVGTVISERGAWIFCDAVTGVMTFINLFCLVKLAPVIRDESRRFGLLR